MAQVFSIVEDLMHSQMEKNRIDGIERIKKSQKRLGLLILTALFLLASPGFCEDSNDMAKPGDNKPAVSSEETTGEEGAPKEIEAAKEHALEEMVVTATRTEKALSDAPAAVSVVTREDMESRNIQTIDSALNLVPGVFDKRSKGLDTTASVTLRGFPEQKRTLVLLDGQPMNDGYTSVVNWNAMLPENVEKIEVARGPFSSLYGGNAMGGVVNIITRIPEKREVILKSGYGSDDYWSSYGSYGDKWFDRFRLFTSYGYQASNGFPTALVVKTPTTSGAGTPVSGAIPTTNSKENDVFLVGDQGDNTWWRDSGTLKFAYDLTENSNATFSFMRNRYHYGYDDPHTFLTDAGGNPVWSGSVLADGNRISLTESNFLTSGGEGGRTENRYNLGYETGLFRDAIFKFSCGLIDQESNWYLTPSSGATRKGGPGTLNETPSTAVFTEAQISIPVFEKHRLTLGTGYRYDEAHTKEHSLTDWRDEDSKGALTYESEGKDNIVSFFTEAEISILSNLTAYVGVRGDWWKAFDGVVNTKGAAGTPDEYDSRDAFSVSPKGSIVYKPMEDTSFRASIGRAFRPPNVYELYRTWVSGTTTYASNPDLDPETSFSWDMGVEQKLFQNAVFRLNYFNNHIYDIIYRKDVSATLKQSINAGEAKTDGIELEMEHRLTGWFKYFGSLTYTHSKMLDNPAKPATEGKQLVGVPELMYGIGGEFTYGPASLTIIGRYADKQYNVDDNTDTAKHVYGVYDSYFVTDLNLRYRVTKWASLDFAVSNLLDEDYFAYYQTPGRKFFGGLTVKF
ncbi:MAG: TonB-dependent receptor [Syntrophobacteraceae bacterium]